MGTHPRAHVSTGDGFGSASDSQDESVAGLSPGSKGRALISMAAMLYCLSRSATCRCRTRSTSRSYTSRKAWCTRPATTAPTTICCSSRSSLRASSRDSVLKNDISERSHCETIRNFAGRKSLPWPGLLAVASPQRSASSDLTFPPFTLPISFIILLLRLRLPVPPQLQSWRRRPCLTPKRKVVP